MCDCHKVHKYRLSKSTILRFFPQISRTEVLNPKLGNIGNVWMWLGESGLTLPFSYRLVQVVISSSCTWVSTPYYKNLGLHIPGRKQPVPQSLCGWHLWLTHFHLYPSSSCGHGRDAVHNMAPDCLVCNGGRES